MISFIPSKISFFFFFFLLPFYIPFINSELLPVFVLCKHSIHVCFSYFPRFSLFLPLNKVDSFISWFRRHYFSAAIFPLFFFSSFISLFIFFLAWFSFTFFDQRLLAGFVEWLQHWTNNREQLFWFLVIDTEMKIPISKSRETMPYFQKRRKKTTACF